MPKGDRTGPMGAGSMSGRGAGLCSGFNAPGYANAQIADRPRMNRRYRRGQGRGPNSENRGWRQRFRGADQPDPIYPEDYPASGRFFKPVEENAPFTGRVQALQSELSEIKARLEKIEEQKT